MDVWFLLLQRPEISKEEDDQYLDNRTQEPTMNTAVKVLVEKFANPHQMKLYFDKKELMPTGCYNRNGHY